MHIKKLILYFQLKSEKIQPYSFSYLYRSLLTIVLLFWTLYLYFYTCFVAASVPLASASYPSKILGSAKIKGLTTEIVICRFFVMKVNEQFFRYPAYF